MKLDLTCSVRKTVLGPVVVKWKLSGSAPVITSILLSSPDMRANRQVEQDEPHAVKSNHPVIDGLLDKLESALSGRTVSFSLKTLNLEAMTDFQKKVLTACFAIPRGMVMGYGQMASRVGSPGGARAVGQVMATNPFPILIPCHRVISAGGQLGGYGYGNKLKRELLALEGIVFTENSKIPQKYWIW